MGTTSAIRTFHGAVALVTGAASGIGRGLSIELARRSAMVEAADIDADGLAETESRINAMGGTACVQGLDVRNPGAWAAWVSGVRARHGRIDYLFSNAGIGGTWGFTDRYDASAWHGVLDINLMGIVHGIHAVYPVLCAQGFGHIVNTASVAGLVPFPLALPYCAAKHAIVGLSQSLRIEARRRGVRVSALCPGVIRTPLLTSSQPAGSPPIPVERLLKWWARARPMEVEPFARVALDLVARNKAVIIVPRQIGPLVALLRSFPGMGERLLARDLAATLRALPEIEQHTGTGSAVPS